MFIYLIITHLETHITYFISLCQLNMSSWKLQVRNMTSVYLFNNYTFGDTYYLLYFIMPTEHVILVTSGQKHDIFVGLFFTKLKFRLFLT